MTEVVLLGGGGHARSLLAALTLRGVAVRGYIALEPSTLSSDCPYLGGDDALDDFDPGSVHLVNGLGSTSSTLARRALHERVTRRGFVVASVIHPRSIVDEGARLDSGVQILAGAIVNVGATVREGAIVNTGAVVEHDTVVGPHAHIAPGAVLAGDVRVEAGAHVGLGARVIQGVVVGSGSVVGAGAVVIDDVAPGSTVVGVPARILPSRTEGAGTDDR